MQSGHSDLTTEGIRVRVAAQFLPERSSPEHNQYFFVYRVRLANVGTEWAKLRSRLWLITDAEDKSHKVQGPGVVGEFPELEPEAQFEYMSGCPLTTEWGTMEGHFVFERKDGAEFKVGVGRFFLALTTDPMMTQD